MNLLRRTAVALVSVTALAALPLSLAAQQPGQTRFQLAATGNEARYRAREQFLNVSFFSDAIGTTSAIKGGIVVDAAGRVIADQSRIVIDVTTLKSDQENRDRMVQTRLLETGKFPTVEIKVTELRGLKIPWPATGALKFDLVGDLTIHGVTKPWTWQIEASPKDGGLAGRASTALKFGDFGMPVPTSMRLLSVEDNLKLEFDFHFVPAK